MPTSLAAKDTAKANGEQRYIETVDPNIVDIRDDLIVADGEADVSLGCGGGVAGGRAAEAEGGRAGTPTRAAEFS